MKDSNLKKLTLKNKMIGFIMILLALWFTVLYFFPPENVRIFIKSHLIYFLWISGYILPLTIFITWAVVRSEKPDNQLRTRRTLLALAIMGIDLLIRGKEKKISDMNTNQIVKELKTHFLSIGYASTLDYNTIKSLLTDNPTNVPPPKKDNRGKK